MDSYQCLTKVVFFIFFLKLFSPTGCSSTITESFHWYLLLDIMLVFQFKPWSHLLITFDRYSIFIKISDPLHTC